MHSANDTSRAPFPDTRLLDHRIAQTRIHCHLKRLASSLQRHQTSRERTIGTFLGYIETGVSNRAGVSFDMYVALGAYTQTHDVQRSRERSPE